MKKIVIKKFQVLFLTLALFSTMFLVSPFEVKAANLTDDFSSYNNISDLAAAWNYTSPNTNASIDNSLDPTNKVLKMSGTSTSVYMKNDMGKTSVFTFKFKFYVPSTTGLKCGIKFYNNNGATTLPEVGRIKLDSGNVQYGIGSPYTVVQPYSTGTWHKIAIVFYPSQKDTDKVTADIYMDDVLYKSGLLGANIYATSVDRFTIFTDSTNAGIFYIDDIKVEDGNTAVAPPTVVSINKTSADLKVGETSNLSATVTPNAQTVSWKSSDETKATVAADGTVTAVGTGVAKVWAYVTENSTEIKSQECTVTVTEPTSISLPTSVIMFVGENKNISATITPVSESSKPITWYSDDNSVATVENGVINGIAAGIATIKASVLNTVGEAVYSQECKVYVNDIPEGLIITIDPNKVMMNVNESTQIRAKVFNASSNDATVSWHTYDTTVVNLVYGTSINTLNINAVGPGDAIIYASVTDAVYGSAYAECIVKVNPLQPITISGVPVSATMYVGDKLQLNANVSDAAKTVTWYTYNDQVATVSLKGLVEAKAVGKVKIRASVSESVYADCDVTVYPVSGNSEEPPVIIPPVTTKPDSINIPVLLEQINNTKGTELTINVPGTGKTIQVTLPVNVFDKIRAKGIEKIQLSSATVSMTLSPDAFDTKNISSVTVDAKQADKSKDLTPAQQKIVGDNQVYDFAISVKNADGTEAKVSKFNKPVEVSIPYTLKNGEDPRKITVFFIGENGELENRAGKYDSATGKVTFSTNHFSKYFVKYNDVSFTDLGNVAWAKEQIEVMASKGIINGTGSSNFSPEKNITRADFLMLLVNTLGLTANVDSNFSDVKSTDYYYNAVGIAKKLGLTNGTGNNTFEPQKEISREDMMSLVARAMKLANKLGATGSTADLQIFKDKNNISDYAAVNVATLVKEGIIKGNGVNIEPKQSTTRAEAAVLLYRIYTK